MHENSFPVQQDKSIRAVVVSVLLCFLFFLLVTPAYDVG